MPKEPPKFRLGSNSLSAVLKPSEPPGKVVLVASAAPLIERLTTLLVIAVFPTVPKTACVNVIVVPSTAEIVKYASALPKPLACTMHTRIAAITSAPDEDPPCLNSSAVPEVFPFGTILVDDAALKYFVVPSAAMTVRTLPIVAF